MLLLRLSALHYSFDYRIIASTAEQQDALERPTTLRAALLAEGHSGARKDQG